MSVWRYRGYIDISNTRFVVNGDIMCFALFVRVMNPKGGKFVK